MKKIDFINNSEPFLSAENLNQMQNNIEEAIGERYSIEETFTGKYWVDGKKIYRKVIVSSLKGRDNRIPLNIQNLDKVFIANNSYIYTNNIFFNPNMLNAGSNIDFQFIKTIINKNNNELHIYLGDYLIAEETNCAITLEYTKTTD